MRTHGPRMNRERTREVLDKLGIAVVKSDGHGVEIHRPVTQPSSDPGSTVIRHYTVIERWRVYTGGGIAGNSDQVWLSPVVRVHGQPRGPYWNKTQLSKALRTWGRGE